jgi:hypothetical protein
MYPDRMVYDSSNDSSGSLYYSNNVFDTDYTSEKHFLSDKSRKVTLTITEMESRVVYVNRRPHSIFGLGSSCSLQIEDKFNDDFYRRTDTDRILPLPLPVFSSHRYCTGEFYNVTISHQSWCILDYCMMCITS